MTVAYYTITTGLAGCYTPNTVSGPLAFHSRKELADAIREEMKVKGFPKSCFRQANIRRVWRFVAKYGSSIAHFSISHLGEEISFHGLTQAEFEAAETE